MGAVLRGLVPLQTEGHARARGFKWLAERKESKHNYVINWFTKQFQTNINCQYRPINLRIFELGHRSQYSK
jgi:hypothetical protein